jgi:hypothetical protein
MPPASSENPACYSIDSLDDRDANERYGKPVNEALRYPNRFG